MDDFEFNYFGEEEGIEESEEFTDDYERRSVRVNRDGKKIRGKNMFWTKKIRFNNPREYEASNIIQELNEGYTRKRISEFEYGTVYNYVCNTGYLPCRKEIRIIFPSDSFEVLVEEANSHEHAEDPDYTGGQSTVYRWSKVATDIIVIGVKNGLRPKVMLRNMRDRNCFANYREPTMIQLYNKITNIKKVLKLTDNLANTHQLRQKLQQHSEVPDNDIEAYATVGSKITSQTRILLKSKLHQTSKQCFQMLRKSGPFQAASLLIMTNP